ncbi:sensor histidine kinase [Sphingomonas prati]|nr:sensor histidine kinase [Sphingomonas prati]
MTPLPEGRTGGGMKNTPTTPDAADRPVRWVERFPVARDRPILGGVATVAIVAAAWALRIVADPLLPPGFPYVTFFPAVIVTSFVFGVRLGAVSAIICGLLAWFFFIPPIHAFIITQQAGIALAFYVFVVATDLSLVHWMQTANRQLARERETNRALADTRELLFRELQHRVSNNLQVAAALLSMQKRQLADPGAKAALNEASARLALIGRISRQLYDPSGAAQPVVPFLAELCRDVVEASGRSDIALDVAGDVDLRLQPDAAVPTALIVAEAVANAVEHGFAAERAGRIEIMVGRGPDGSLTILVQDDGHGLPADFRADNTTSLGLQIATTLARGQSGSFRLHSDTGTTATLSLPAHLLATED